MNSMKTDLLYAKLLCLCFALFLIFIAEGVSRIFFRENRLDKILNILKEDAVLFWRQKPNLDVHFQGADLRTDSLGLRNKREGYFKDEETFRIVCLGASPTFGWGVEYEDTYPYRLEKLLKKRMGKKIEVINAANIGYTSYQGLVFLNKEIDNLNPDLITVSYVLNDLDKYRFYRSNGKPDKELTRVNSFMVGLRNILSNSKFYRLLTKLFNKVDRVKSSLYCLRELRVSPEDYRKNLQAIVDIAKGHGIKVVFIKMPVNLPVAAELTELSRKKTIELFAAAIEYMESKMYNKAIESLNNAVKHNPYSSRTFYYLGICFEKAGNVSKAKEYFAQAKKAEAYRCGKDGIVYNAIMEDVAVKEELCLVDIVSAFQEIEDEYLFIHRLNDPIHPNATGHKIIGSEIYKNLLANNLLPD